MIALVVLVGVWVSWPTSARQRVAVPRVAVAEEAPTVDPALVLDLVATAVESGADLPRALATVGAALDGPVGDELCRVAASLLLGADWRTAWADCREVLDPVRSAVEPAWTSGAAAGPALRSAAADERRTRRARAREAAARLSVRLVLPLGLCFLPAFVLVGVVPVVISLATHWGGWP